LNNGLRVCPYTFQLKKARWTKGGQPYFAVKKEKRSLKSAMAIVKASKDDII
jgi:hypothetical protein